MKKMKLEKIALGVVIGVIFLVLFLVPTKSTYYWDRLICIDGDPCYCFPTINPTSKYGYLKVYVEDSEGKAVGGASVKIYSNLTNGLIRQGTTDNYCGVYETYLNKGEYYYVKVEKDTLSNVSKVFYMRPIYMVFLTLTPTCVDNDGDGYAINGGECGPIDCNDSDASINPGVWEVCNNGLDDNCNGIIDLEDEDCKPANITIDPFACGFKHTLCGWTEEEVYCAYRNETVLSWPGIRAIFTVKVLDVHGRPLPGAPLSWEDYPGWIFIAGGYEYTEEDGTALGAAILDYWNGEIICDKLANLTVSTDGINDTAMLVVWKI